MKYKYFLLDHGYIEVVETWGSDSRIIEAARMSTDKQFRGWGDDKKPGDEKLLAYLYNNKHMTPFEMAGMTIEVQAPIFVFREWHRHRTQSYNELSARYTPLPDVNYIPTVDRLMIDGGKNKQAQGSRELTKEFAEEFIVNLKNEYNSQQKLYEYGLAVGVPKELARLVIPVGRYSKMRASANLRNWLQFLILRTSENAQWEIREYANTVSELVKQMFPRTHKLFVGEKEHD